MPSNDNDLLRAKIRDGTADREAVADAVRAYLERLAAVSRVARTEVDADLRAAGRLMARNTRRQLAANLTLARRMLEARTLPAMLDLQQDYLRRQADWAMRDWERAAAQALDLLEEGRRAARGGPSPEPAPPAPDEAESEPPPSASHEAALPQAASPQAASHEASVPEAGPS